MGSHENIASAAATSDNVPSSQRCGTTRNALQPHPEDQFAAKYSESARLDSGETMTAEAYAK